MAVKMEVFNEGDIVKYKSLSVGVILSIFKPIGTYKSYTVLLFDNQKTVTASRVNLEHYMSMEEQVEICSEEVDFGEILMTEQQPKSRFADSSEEVIEKDKFFRLIFPKTVESRASMKIKMSSPWCRPLLTIM